MERGPRITGRIARNPPFSPLQQKLQADKRFGIDRITQFDLRLVERI